MHIPQLTAAWISIDFYQYDKITYNYAVAMYDTYRVEGGKSLRNGNYTISHDRIQLIKYVQYCQDDVVWNEATFNLKCYGLCHDSTKSMISGMVVTCARPLTAHLNNHGCLIKLLCKRTETSRLW